MGNKGVFALASLFKQNGGCKSIKGYYSGNGRPSGGTLHTMIHMLTTVPLRKMTDYHLLSPPSVFIYISSLIIKI